MRPTLYTDKKSRLLVPPEAPPHMKLFLQDVADELNKPPLFKSEFLDISASSTIAPDRLVVYLCRASSNITVTLPRPGNTRSLNFYIKNASPTYSVDVASVTGQVDGQAFYSISTTEAVHVVSDTTNWWIL